jgi:hypothetical protein
VSRWRKKPVVIEAWQFGPAGECEELPEWIDPRWFYRDVDGKAPGKRVVEWGAAQYMLIPTPEGTLRATLTDWIIRGVHGEVYPCKADVFAVTYERFG